MSTNTIHRNLHNAVAFLVLASLVGLSLHDFHAAFVQYDEQLKKLKTLKTSSSADTGLILMYLLGIGYGCLIYCELQMHRRRGALFFRILLHLVTGSLALFPHLLKHSIGESLVAANQPLTLQASLINPELPIALVLFLAIELELAYLVWHLNNPPRGHGRNGRKGAAPPGNPP